MIDFSKKRILVTGGAGFLGSHIVSELKSQGCDMIFVPRYEFHDLRAHLVVREMLRQAQPHIVIHTAASVGGIALNQAKPADMFYDNITMGVNLIHLSHEFGVEKFVQIGTACEYPSNLKPPFLETEVWEGYPEETNAAYGIAKRALLTMGHAYRQQHGFNVIHLLLTNLYGPGDNFDPWTSHVIPGMIQKFVEAQRTCDPLVTLWGSGRPTRDFLYVKDAAKAIVKAVERYNGDEPLNIGTGEETSIGSLAVVIATEVGYLGTYLFNLVGVDGQLRRKLDIERMKKVLDFYPQTVLSSGLAETIKWYKESRA